MGAMTDWIKARSSTTGWVDPFNIGGRVRGNFNASVEWVPFVSGTDVYDARYGDAAHNMKGNLVGERFNRVTVQNAIDTGKLTGVPVGYQITRVEEEDLKLVTYPPYSFSSIYDTIIVPLGQETAPPGPVAPPPPPPPPVDPPPPAPVDPGPVVVSVSRVPLFVFEYLDDLKEYLDDFGNYAGMTFIGKGRQAKFGKAKELSAAIDAWVSSLKGVVN